MGKGQRNSITNATYQPKRSDIIPALSVIAGHSQMHFMRRVVILWLALTVLIGSAVLHGRSYPESGGLQALGFEICERWPCYLGITAGLTRRPDAEKTLNRPTHNQFSVELITYPGFQIGDDPTLSTPDPSQAPIDLIRIHTLFPASSFVQR